jgi:hypothetical protein
MCDAMREPPQSGTELFCFWKEEPIPVVGEQRNLQIGDWDILVRIVRVKDSTYAPDRKHVTMEVLG